MKVLLTGSWTNTLRRHESVCRLLFISRFTRNVELIDKNTKVLIPMKAEGNDVAWRKSTDMGTVSQAMEAVVGMAEEIVKTDEHYRSENTTEETGRTREPKQQPYNMSILLQPHPLSLAWRCGRATYGISCRIALQLGRIPLHRPAYKNVPLTQFWHIKGPTITFCSVI